MKRIADGRHWRCDMGAIGAAWGLAGVLLLLTSAVYRLSFIALQAFSYHFFWYHWLFLAAVIIFMGYAEGYRGFQQRFSPRVAARARYLRDHPQALLVLFSPFFLMGYFHAPRKRRIVSISLTICIIFLIIAVRQLAQPWRGILDGGVVFGLAWGIVSLLLFAYRALTAVDFPYAPEVPGQG